jgi:hypothetical protein
MGRKKKKGPQKKRKKRNRSATDTEKLVKPIVTLPVPKTSQTRRDELKSKLNGRLNGLRMSRSSGASPQMNKAFSSMGGVNHTDADMMQDLQDDMKGLKPNKIKKYMKNMMSGMDQGQSEAVGKMVKQHAPGASKDIDNLVTAHSNNLQSKTVVDTKTVYVPKSQRPTLASTTTTKKKKKTFRRITIAVPKIADLRSLTLDNEPKNHLPAKPFVKSGFSTNPISSSQQDINDLFNKRVYVPYKTRMVTLSAFSHKTFRRELDSQVVFASPNIQFITFNSVTRLPLPTLMVKPGSETCTTLEKVPNSVRHRLTTDWCLEGNFAYKEVENGVEKVENCLDSCADVHQKYDPVVETLKQLVKVMVPLEWLLEYLHALGITLKQSSGKTLTFFLHCQEFETDDLESESVSVPELPFLTLQIE